MQRDLRSFGLIWAIIFTAIGFYPILNDSPVRNWAICTALTFVILSLIYPKIYQKTLFYPAWIKFGNFLGMINSKIIIFLLFYILFLPIGVILKICRKDLLSKKLDNTANSYFIDRVDPIQSMSNQF